MERNKVCIIIPYFGKLGEKYQLFYESCRRNQCIDWLIFTDDTNYYSNGNVYVKHCKLSDINTLIEEKLKVVIEINNAYKLCDLRPLYGCIFSDYLKGYDYWGYGDIDVIYGDLQGFLEEIDYKQYDKINRTGHFSIVRNDEKCVKAFMKSLEGTLDYRLILEDISKNYGFDERDFNKKFDNLGLSIFSKKFAADIDTFYKRMRLVDKKTIKYLCKFSGIDWTPKNYKKQIFVLEDGKIYRYFIKNSKVTREEFAYIHYRWSGIIKLRDICDNTFIISRRGFFELSQDQLSGVKKISELINKYNKYENGFIEMVRFVYYYLKERKNNRMKR